MFKTDEDLLKVSSKKLIEYYSFLKDDEKLIKNKLTSLKNELAERLHIEKVNEIFIDDKKDIKWKIGYQSKTRKSVDYTVLFEKLGSHMYGEVVQEKESTFLTIRKAPKIKKTKINKKPVEGKLKLPIGNLS